jgi:hypothetical protein
MYSAGGFMHSPTGQGCGAMNVALAAAVPLALLQMGLHPSSTAKLHAHALLTTELPDACRARCCCAVPTFAAPPTSSLKSAVREKYCLLCVSRAAVASWPCKHETRTCTTTQGCRSCRACRSRPRKLAAAAAEDWLHQTVGVNCTPMACCRGRKPMKMT